ncbi:MAG: Gfo/Idh/MocA family oxidoreductase [Planctomycetes bacterium]|nr:Gfo/Idh/MocA family oxidoreductase [Planctomycetota bacterium]
MNMANDGVDRRMFLGATGAVAMGGLLSASPLSAMGARSRDELRVGLVGCGGRGTGAAVNALNADPNVRLVALGDMFPERVERALAGLLAEDETPAAPGAPAPISTRVDVPPERRFSGFDAIDKVLAAGIDIVILATPPGFRPDHIERAVKAGKHMFVEKPVAVDTPGLIRVRKACKDAAAKGLVVVSGLCWRYDNGMRATFEKVHAGGIGTLRAMQCAYLTGSLWHHGRKPEWSEADYQIRNWLYFNWLSGDHLNEQAIHSLDKLLWAQQNVAPAKVIGMGGRQVRTDAKFGHIYDHFSLVYTWPDGVKGFFWCRQMDGCANDVSDHLFGSEGVCDVFKHSIDGAHAWKYTGPSNNMYQTEWDELVAAVRAGKTINNGDYMVKSTMMAIMGRMAAYTGGTITWEQAWESQEDLTPAGLRSGDALMPPVAMPGITKFV